MTTKRVLSLLAAIGVLAATSLSQAQLVVYDNLDTSATAGYSQAFTGNPVFGDALNLTQGGVLTKVGLSLFNSSSGGNTGTMLGGTTLLKFYDNTTPYSGGAITGALLGSTTVTWDLGAEGLPIGYYVTDTFDVASAGINLPKNILITQQFTQTSGTSTRSGLILASEPVVGTSPNSVYIFSSTTAEGLYTFSNNPGQFGYRIEVIPEPASFMLLGFGALAMLVFRRR